MKKLTLLTVLTVLSVSVVFAKRAVPMDVAPLKSGQVEYRVPHDRMGIVEAWDTKTDALIWRRQIFVVRYDVELERDVQDVFIKTIQLAGRGLVITNERGSEYQLDLETLEVKVRKGRLVERAR